MPSSHLILCQKEGHLSAGFESGNAFHAGREDIQLRAAKNGDLHGLLGVGEAFLIFLPTSILVQLFPDAVLVGWVGFYLCGWVPGRYLIRIQEKLGQ